MIALFIILFLEKRTNVNIFILTGQEAFYKMNWEIINGYVGGVLSAALFVPQLYKMYQTKSAIELSWTFLLVSNIGSIFSIFYYIEIEATPMIYTNAFSLVTRILMLIYKYHLDKQNNNAYVPMDETKILK